MWGQCPTLIFVWGHLPPLPTYSCTYVHVYLLNNYTHVCIFLYLAKNLEKLPCMKSPKEVTGQCLVYFWLFINGNKKAIRENQLATRECITEA